MGKTTIYRNFERSKHFSFLKTDKIGTKKHLNSMSLMARIWQQARNTKIFMLFIFIKRHMSKFNKIIIPKTNFIRCFEK
ncbi:hypothetical protein SAMN04487768_0532 [Burkholderia sp. b13]|nr:hypothetical protein SAMN04487768_0532 [Burkholderia sp. b13]